MNHRLLGLALSAALSVAFLPGRSVHACGGTFCDGGPQPMPVDQRGENILFSIADGKVEAHIQIQYKGEAQKFAWVLPVQKLPEFEAGSQELFTRLLQGTVPTVGFQSTFDQCNAFNGAPSADAGGGTGGSGSAGKGGGSGGGNQPTVVFQGSVGAFDISVLQGGDTAEVVQWLDDNGFQQNDKAPAILTDYLAKGYLFAAIKLNGRAGTEEIHPLVVRYEGTTPCVPLKLTAIAAVEDMVVRTFFLGGSRVMPTSYKHVVPSPLAVDWTQAAASYFPGVSRAVDAPVADGKAFVTEYAGPSNVIPSSGIRNPKWNATPFETATEKQALALLGSQGLLTCSLGCAPDAKEDCRLRHPLLEGILAANLDFAPDAKIGDVLCAAEKGGPLPKYSASAGVLAKAIDERIVKPAAHAEELLNNSTYLTRLVTTISPVEMTSDPEFVEVGAIGDVPAQRLGTMRTLCTQERVFTFPDGREAYVGKGAWPANDFAKMRQALRIEEVDLNGNVKVLVDNRDAIDAELLAWNKAHDWPPSATFGVDDGASTSADPDGGCAVAGREDGATWSIVGLFAAFFALRVRRRA